MSISSSQDCLDNYYWRKNVGKKRIKTRWCRTSSSIKYCYAHDWKGAHAVVPRSFNNLKSKIQETCVPCNSETDIIKFNSRKSIRGYQKIMNRSNNQGYICRQCKSGFRRSFSGYITDLKKNIEKDYKKYSKNKKKLNDNIFEGREAYLKRKAIFEERNIYNGDDLCGICMTKMNGKIVVTTACKHSFCKGCYNLLKDFNYRQNNYQRYTLKCPMCRSDIFKGKQIEVITAN